MSQMFHGSQQRRDSLSEVDCEMVVIVRAVGHRTAVSIGFFSIRHDNGILKKTDWGEPERAPH